jgi:hypothetical protein
MKSRTENAEERRTKDLSATVEPRCILSKIDIELPKRHIPNIEMDEPRPPKLLKANDAPTVPKSSTDTDAPAVQAEQTDKPDAKRMKPLKDRVLPT